MFVPSVAVIEYIVPTAVRVKLVVKPPVLLLITLQTSVEVSGFVRVSVTDVSGRKFDPNIVTLLPGG